MYAPQWADLVEEANDWPGLAEAVWWMHSHTKDRLWSVDKDVRDTWIALSAEKTPLLAEDLLDGAVDVEWFRRIYGQIGAKRWGVVYRAAKLCSTGVGHTRAKLFANSMLGNQDIDELTTRIAERRHQDSVRAVGLVPLPKGRATAKELLRRYELIREFEKGSAKFGNQRKMSERTAVRVGLENLARTAGFTDPIRFGWAMEFEQFADLADGPVVLDRDDGLKLSLSVDDSGLPMLEIERNGKSLKSVPAKSRKQPEIVALKTRAKALTEQSRRVRTALEVMMVRGEVFERHEIETLRKHPLIGPQLGALLLVDGRRKVATSSLDRQSGEVALLGPTGRTRTLQEPLRIAHAADLLASKEWRKWQSYLMDRQLSQPFKQAFRELYVLTPREKDGKRIYESLRYRGHQVQPKQARALLNTRNWHVLPDAGSFSKTFHSAGVVAQLELWIDHHTAGAELPTVGAIRFSERGGKSEPLLLSKVDPLVFSEAMRDIDLVVSVAHAGGVDPEASQSTMEMRGALARETARILQLDNVQVEERQVRIEGDMGTYLVHLGSGVVHQLPGHTVWISAAPSQRRGRIFLPFADDDPLTAEIMSKMLLLANDSEILDATIVSQIRRAR